MGISLNSVDEKTVILALSDAPLAGRLLAHISGGATWLLTHICRVAPSVFCRSLAVAISLAACARRSYPCRRARSSLHQFTIVVV